VGIAKNGLMSEFDVTGFTTPDAVQLQQIIAYKLASEGEPGSARISALAIEASSIGLQQGRMNGMHVDVAVLTNFTRDHLDFHGDMTHYEAAKTKLFEWPHLKTAIVNLDDALGMRLAQLCHSRGVAVIGYSLNSTDFTSNLAGPASVLKASAIRNYHGGTSFHLESPFGSGVIKTQTVGRFNVSNVLTVLATLFVRGIGWREAVRAVEQLTSVAGRMEQLSASRGAADRVLVIIDYAHTPDALEKTLLNLREIADDRHGKLWCVFGCGGDRDRGKRPAMAKIAELADEIIVTSDNPRSEEPELIMTQIASGFTPNRSPVPLMESDRAKAILYAVKHAGRHDVVLLAGKGHESHQEIKGKKLPFSDMDHAHMALATIASKGMGI
jgi:UDP-N-acetylmuramoyl-L-alanyl-D-glutamate--2,6-diaminopimelate ligase